MDLNHKVLVMDFVEMWQFLGTDNSISKKDEDANNSFLVLLSKETIDDTKDLSW